MATIIKITIEDVSSLRKQVKREFYSYCSISWNYPVQYSLLKTFSDGLERDRMRFEDLDVHKSHVVGLCPHTLNQTVYVVFDGRYDLQPRG